MSQSNTRVGDFRVLAGEDLAGKEARLVKLTHDTGVAEVKLPEANSDHVPYVLIEGAADAKLVSVRPMPGDRNVRITLKGTCNPGDVMVLADVRRRPTRGRCACCRSRPARTAGSGSPSRSAWTGNWSWSGRRRSGTSRFRSRWPATVERRHDGKDGRDMKRHFWNLDRGVRGDRRGNGPRHGDARSVARSGRHQREHGGDAVHGRQGGVHAGGQDRRHERGVGGRGRRHQRVGEDRAGAVRGGGANGSGLRARRRTT